MDRNQKLDVMKKRKLNEFEQLFCTNIHDFVKSNIDKITDTWEYLGFKDGEDMLTQLLTDIDVAVWALTELLWWGMDKNYTALEFEECKASNNNMYNLVSDTLEDEVTIYKLKDGDKTRYFKLKLNTRTNVFTVIEVKKEKKVIEVAVWENA